MTPLVAEAGDLMNRPAEEVPSRRSLDAEQRPMPDTYLKYHLPFYRKLYQRRLLV